MFSIPAFSDQRRAVLAALSSPVQRELLHSGLAVLEARNWQIDKQQQVYENGWFSAGTIDSRVAAIEYWLQSDCPFLWNARGGYGCLEVLPRLHAEDFQRKNGWIIGSSDTTSLQLWLLAKAKLGSLYGPMPSGAIARGLPEASLARVEDLLAGNWTQVRLPEAMCQNLKWLEVPNAAPRLQKVSGRAVGGCLTLVTGAVAAGFMPDTTGTILFLEDIAEHPFRIVRMLETLRQAGAFDAVSAVVLGTFPNCEPPGGAGYTLDLVLSHFFANDSFPVLWGYPFGHVEDGLFCDTIVLGATYELDSRQEIRQNVIKIT